MYTWPKRCKSRERHYLRAKTLKRTNENCTLHHSTIDTNSCSWACPSTIGAVEAKTKDSREKIHTIKRQPLAAGPLVKPVPDQLSSYSQAPAASFPDQVSRPLAILSTLGSVVPSSSARYSQARGKYSFNTLSISSLYNVLVKAAGPDRWTPSLRFQLQFVNLWQLFRT
jgi:hypothetical protein